MTVQLDGKWSWVYLVNLVFYLLPLFYLQLALWQIVVAVAVLLAFVWCYFWAYRVPTAQMHWPVLCMLALAVGVTPLNPGSIALFAYAGFFIGFARPLRQAIVALLAVLLIMLALHSALGFNGPFFLLYGGLLVLAVTGFGVLERQRQLRLRQQQRSQEEIAQLAQMVERERIARDLHDIMGHSLSSIVLKADLAKALLKAGNSEEAALHLTELAQVARDSLSQVRQTVSGYKHKGLLAEVSTLVQRLREHGFAVTLEGEVPKLAAREESALILVLTELVTNILRHSKGDSCRISFREQDQGFVMEVADNGEVTNFGFGNGLTGVTERLHALQAKLDYQLDAGCQLKIWLPNVNSR
ncbi:MAG: sensor histidine kinase [Rheinheimera sp.]|nr:MAG: sensor histidine kinase [Rheinheimera sp.]